MILMIIISGFTVNKGATNRVLTGFLFASASASN